MTDKLTVYLHIGSGKVGSSSMHYWLLRAEKELNRQGILMLDQAMKPHTPVEQNWIWNQSYTFRHLMPDVPDRVDQFAEKMAHVSNHMRQHGFHSVIISSILLSSWAANGRFEELFAPLVDQYDWRVIYYVRNQHAYLTSAWKQWHYADSRFANVDDWLSQVIGHEGNWLASLQPWATLFGPERVTVRVLDRRFLRNGSLWDDFAHILGVPNTIDDQQQQNDSFDNRTVTTLNAMVRYAGFRPYETTFTKMLIEERAQDLGFGKDTDTSVIGPEWYERIREAYAEPNRQLVAQYFTDERVLESFEMPVAKTKFTMTMDEVIVHGLRLLMRIVYHIDQENRSFRQKIGNLHHENQVLKESQKRLEEKVNDLLRQSNK